MSKGLMQKHNTEISSEFIVEEELARTCINVTMTFGTTKSLDLLVEKEGKLISVQVKGLHQKKSIYWKLSLSKFGNLKAIYVLINLSADTLDSPEYFILTDIVVKEYLMTTKSGRDYLDYKVQKN